MNRGGFMFTTLIQLAVRNLMYLALHLDGGGTFPKKLSKEEERECLELIAEGNHEARNKLIEHNLRLVAFIVKKQYFEHKEPEDLISIGAIGLIRAVETFSLDKNISFSTYASKCIDNQIKVGGLLRHQIIWNGNAVNLRNRRLSAWGSGFYYSCRNVTRNS
jgi:RNA polymerase sporulation-specific sigma factor